MAALALARAAYFAAALLLFGSTALMLLIRARLPHIPRVGLPRLRWSALALALIAAILWFVLATAQMAGDPVAALKLATLAQAASDTLFGWGFLARLAALMLLGAALIFRRDAAALAASGVALAAPALTSHAATTSPAHFAAIGITMDAVHLFTAGFWIGGLAVLAALFARRAAQADLLLVLGLFSEWAMMAVLLLAMTGLIDGAQILLGTPGRASPLYLGVLGLKLACVAAMLILAVLNRFRLMPNLIAGDAEARLKRNIALELGLGLAAIALAGLLGQLAPTMS